MTAGQVALAALVGGLLVLERKTFGQFMLSRPIVVAPIIAALLGDARAGLAVGIPLELFFLGTTSYGASTPDHETLTAVFAGALVATAAGAAAAPVPPPYALACSVFIALPLAPLGRLVEAGLERANEVLIGRAEEALARGRTGLATRQALLATAALFVLGAVVTAAGALAGPALGTLEELLPPSLRRGLGLAWALFVGTCGALGLRAIRTPGGAVLSGVAALTVFAVFGLAMLLLMR